MNYGLKPHIVDSICKVFEASPKIEKVLLYGSRAKGNFRRGSDIDLTIVGDKLNLSDLFAVENRIDDLLLPYKIDISLFHHIDNQALIEHVNRVGVVFYKNESTRSIE